MEKHLRTIIATAVLILALSSTAGAGESETFDVTVSITASASISVTGGPINFGTMGVGSTDVSSSAITVTNDGSGSDQTYSVALVDPSGWTAVTAAPGFDEYRLSAAFDADGASITWSPTNHALTTTSTASSASKFAGDQSGTAVPYNETRSLYLQLETPSATASPSAKTIQVSITASVD
ncbi:hypothetical protein ACFL28_04825 [Candidatus Omnitrophota bacterium]